MECSVGNGLGGTEGKWKKQLTRLGLVRCKEVFKEQRGLWGGNTKCRLEVSPKSDVRITAADVCDGVSSCLKRMLQSHRQSHSTSEWLHYRHSEKYHQDIATFADKRSSIQQWMNENWLWGWLNNPAEKVKPTELTIHWQLSKALLKGTMTGRMKDWWLDPGTRVGEDCSSY